MLDSQPDYLPKYLKNTQNHGIKARRHAHAEIAHLGGGDSVLDSRPDYLPKYIKNTQNHRIKARKHARAEIPHTELGAWRGQKAPRSVRCDVCTGMPSCYNVTWKTVASQIRCMFHLCYSTDKLSRCMFRENMVFITVHYTTLFSIHLPHLLSGEVVVIVDPAHRT